MHRDRLRLLSAVWFVCALAYSHPSEHADTVLAIDSGQIRGTYESPGSPVRVFRGIPYARPPVGELRWRPPEPALSWTGTKDCIKFAPSCPQPPQRFVRDISGPQSEDCLYLNVWTTAERGDGRPVMVWIHGGSFAIGSGSQPTYDGSHFAEDGVVEVTINYRLGPFGFMAHPALSAESPNHVSGNYGLLDQIEALKWVQRNIASFGGDPHKVTIFGESAGSVSVGCLIASPLAKGLFQRAIMESGEPSNLPLLHSQGERDSSAESMGEEIAEELGITNSGGESASVAAKLRSESADSLLKTSRLRIGLFGKGRRMGPAIDGYVLPRDPLDIYAAGEENDVPVLLGSNADEGTLFIQEIPIKTPVGYQIAQKMIFGDFAERIMAMFPVHSPEEVKPAIAHLVTVSAFVAPARRAARALSAHDRDVWLYHFTRVSPALRERNFGATHGAEIFYVFKNIPKLVSPEQSDIALATAMHSAWVRFALRGDPNGGELPDWPAFSTENDIYFEFGDRLEQDRHLMSKESDLLDEIKAYRDHEKQLPKE